MRLRFSTLAVLAVLFVAPSAQAESDGALWGWSISGGGNFGFGLRTDLKTSPVNAMQNMPALHPTVVGPTRAAAAAARNPKNGRVVYGSDAGGAWYVDPESSWGETAPNETINWRLPDSAVSGGSFVIEDGSWGEVVSSSQSANPVSGADDAVAYGASVELSHALWTSEDARWGVDIAFGLSWMRANNCYRSSGMAVSRSATLEHGHTMTDIPMDELGDPWYEPEPDGTWGAAAYDGSQTTGRRDYIIDLDGISSRSVVDSTQSYCDSLRLSAHGDYEEWELYCLLRPWYDINDWLCVHGAVGMGVTRSSFDYAMEAICNGSTIYRSSEEFSEWRCYGIAGAGLLARIWRFDLSCDGLFRWCQQDMDINGKDVQGSIEKPWAVFRLGLSYAF